jgi:hypothetical protein
MKPNDTRHCGFTAATLGTEKFYVVLCFEMLSVAILNVIMLGAIMPNVIMLSGIILSRVMPSVLKLSKDILTVIDAECRNALCSYNECYNTV